MGTIKIEKVKKEIESLSAQLSSDDAQHIFYDILFKKKVEEGLEEADKGMLSDWHEFKSDIKTWYKSK